ncbi:retinol dehydrogenase 14 isoform X2 [Harpegnathos saltator]|uniref:Retinol dehydrogenase 14 n=2 Tax=Harpegnathos saltator TaxID=610380 RepID=E2BNF8_HARSA|nr:retinol dehydrogenase 14 isoform X2 [Harpegnathos saltator]XP_011142168.1 retinol dehydrogenase 14 isoform X2 [Harpegnathos saltator]XP_011142169.1 retinol dehydrogenase 14 isoform X2 [Harpegnathos saltator]XP_025163799.1 retinol dehydrogenase 14 isoform X2 [Harpegnathos saltator]XP_025163806.1 retinol dehydrogenase 14 isoform X2 [Harpegnathos saltator]EFN82737.1 Retinol dehydrogenase 14 [Harpegnathos saltator]
MILYVISCTKLLCLAATVALGGAVLLLVGLYFYNCFTRGVCKSKNRMDGKTVIITGCTSGIGKETARNLAKRGAKVIMACRNTDNANQLKDEIVKETSNSNIVVHKLDLSSLQSIREFARQINREETRLDVLIHNAGTAETFQKKLTEDGLEMTMGTNHFGPFLLTHLLIDLLKRSKPSRIVVVASELYRIARLNLNNINPTSTFPAYLYYVSKYANIVFTLELARRLEGTGVTANCLHPGMIDSGIWRNVPAPLSWFLTLIIKAFFKTPEQGAQTTIHLAVSEELNGVSGKYFMDCAEHRLSNGVKEPSKGKKLWELSEPLVKLQLSDPKI